ncbi:hypothetical protein FGE12_01860 [Aggregicoccus sp. 17bor-14]|uniref:hypothetical protein n=1 Tax=Myxococcaceae TaxID=31 RepID=UPI00129CA000|nr:MULTISPECIES: hypothetical protein [Myxococcaceae]MBF5041122.1 hypothetical protein [Simulacricoccus sp. 17bor-14]MRI86909.1 hypothetical protein [Aggregicoccus sp. 17bor-14]
MADATGVLLLDVRDGKVLLDWEAPRDASARFFVDEGHFALEGAPSCAGAFLRGRMLQRCGSRLVYFNGTAAALLQLAPPRLRAQARLEAAQVVSPKPGRLRARIPFGSRTLVLQGVVYLH